MKHFLSSFSAKLLALTAEDILIRWVNFQLKRVCDNRRIKGFNKELQDGAVYTYLLTAVAPQQTDLLPLQVCLAQPQCSRHVWPELSP